MNAMRWSRGQMRLGERQMRRTLRAMSEMMSMPFPAAPVAPELTEITEFGSNPGQLRMLVQPPPVPTPGASLILLLHGCGQGAARFASASGWDALAARLGATLLLPEQAADHAGNRCFNWFLHADTRRGGGEALSIRQMVGDALTRYAADPRRVFIAGLSAGGAMAAAMLAAYPDLFAAGAAIAALPVGSARNAGQALSRMRHAERGQNADFWADRVREAAPVRFSGPWPRLSIWHGEADHVVDPGNAALLAAQWTALHGLAAESEIATPHPGVRRQIWGDPARPAVERWSIARMGHGVPIDPALGGTSMPYVLDAGVDGAVEIARFWGLL